MADVRNPASAADGLPPAFRLACACCVWPPSEVRDVAIRASARDVDWERFLRVVARQRVRGLAYAALKSAGIVLPTEVEAQLAGAAQATAVRALSLAAEAIRLGALFEAQRLPVLFIKGAALAQVAYGGQALKHCRDIDLLVSPREAERAFALLEEEGYRPIIPKGPLTPAQRRIVFALHKDMELSRADRRLNIELHWRLIDNPVLLSRVDVAAPSQEVEVLNGRLATLADPELFAYLVTHGATHGWSRLKWLADLAAWLSTKREADVVTYYAQAEALGVEACAGQALLMCQRLLAYPIPDALSPKLEGAKLRWLVRSSLDAMIGTDGETELNRRPFGPFRLLAPQFARGRGLRFFWAQCRLLIDNLDDRLDHPLPAALHFLYPALRLPFWLLRVRRRSRTTSV